MSGHDLSAWRAAFLGALQGATEFLPVSSSGHLVIAPELLGWAPPGLTFDVAVHAATAIAVLIYFRADWARLLSGTFAAVRSGRLTDSPEAVTLLMLAAATVPAAVAGLAIEPRLEDALLLQPRQAARLAALLLPVTGLLLVASERMAAFQGRSRPAAVQADGALGRRAGVIGLRTALLIGVAQALAILPGISRSGATIAMGLALGLPRAEAARFSFLLATPVILGAAALQVAGALGGDADPSALPSMAAGAAAALVVGYASIGWLMAFVRRATLHVFAAYTVIAGLAAWYLLR